MTIEAGSYLPEGLAAPTWSPDELEKNFWTGLNSDSNS